MFLLICLPVIIGMQLQAQDTIRQEKIFEIKPAIGATGSPVKPTISVMVLRPLNYRFSAVSHSMTSFLMFSNTPQYIKTHYNYSLSQKFGIGYSLYGKKKSRHTLLALGGIRHIAFKETLEHPELERISISTHHTVADYGLMYELSVGKRDIRLIQGYIFLSVPSGIIRRNINQSGLSGSRAWNQTLQIKM